MALDGVKCRKSNQKCEGIWCCEFFDPEFLKDYEQWGHDQEKYKEIFHKRREMNGNEQASALGKAAV